MRRSKKMPGAKVEHGDFGFRNCDFGIGKFAKTTITTKSEIEHPKPGIQNFPPLLTYSCHNPSFILLS